MRCPRPARSLAAVVAVPVALVASLAASAQPIEYPQEHALSGFFSYVRQLELIDVDADGDLDIFTTDFQSSIYKWYESDGGDPPTFTERTFAVGSAEIDVEHADFDGDGDTDIVLSFPNADRITWYENDGSSPPVFIAHDVAVGVHDYPWTLEATDLDADGDVDVVAHYNSSELTVWYENDGAQPLPGFTERTIDAAAGNLRGLSAADVDGDGDTDLFFSGFNAFDGGTGPFDDFDGIGWYENLGGDPPAWAKREIVRDDNTETHFRCVASDIDGDGDSDAVCTIYFPGVVVYYENSGTNPPSWTRRDVGLSDVCYDVAVEDLDADGDLDVVTQARGDDAVTWFESSPGPSRAAMTWTAHVIPTTLDRPEAVAAGDLTGDGLGDLAVGWVNSKVVTWHPAVAPPPPCVADLDGDADVDVFDFGVFAGNFGSAGLPPGTGGDYDGDGDVDVFDFGVFAGDFGCAP